MFGPLIGGAVTQYATWRWCKSLRPILMISAYKHKGFYINLPAGAVVVGALLFINIPRPKHQKPLSSDIWTAMKTLDVVGFVLFAPSAIMFLLALEWGGITYPWNSPTIIGLFCGAAGTFAVFLFWEYKAGDLAMIPFGMMKRKITLSSCFTMFFLAANINMTGYYIAIYFQAVTGVSPLISGVHILPSILSQMFVAVAAGILSRYSWIETKQSTLIVCSDPTWLLLAMGNWRVSSYVDWMWLAQYPYSFLFGWSLDRIPNYYWSRPWFWSADSKFSLASSVPLLFY